MDQLCHFPTDEVVEVLGEGREESPAVPHQTQFQGFAKVLQWKDVQRLPQRQGAAILQNGRCEHFVTKTRAGHGGQETVLNGVVVQDQRDMEMEVFPGQILVDRALSLANFRGENKGHLHKLLQIVIIKARHRGAAHLGLGEGLQNCLTGELIKRKIILGVFDLMGIFLRPD